MGAAGENTMSQVPAQLEQPGSQTKMVASHLPVASEGMARSPGETTAAERETWSRCTQAAGSNYHNLMWQLESRWDQDAYGQPSIARLNEQDIPLCGGEDQKEKLRQQSQCGWGEDRSVLWYPASGRALEGFHKHSEYPELTAGRRQWTDNGAAVSRLDVRGKSLSADRLEHQCPPSGGTPACVSAAVGSIPLFQKKRKKRWKQSTQSHFLPWKERTTGFLQRKSLVCNSPGHEEGQDSVLDRRADQIRPNERVLTGQAASQEANRATAVEEPFLFVEQENTTAEQLFSKTGHEELSLATEDIEKLATQKRGRTGADEGFTRSKLQSSVLEVGEAGDDVAEIRDRTQPLIRQRNIDVLMSWTLTFFEKQRHFVKNYGGVIEELLRVAVYTVPVEPADGEQTGRGEQGGGARQLLPLLQAVLEVFTLYRHHFATPEAKCSHNVVAERVALEDENERHIQVSIPLKTKTRCLSCELRSGRSPICTRQTPYSGLGHACDSPGCPMSSAVFSSSPASDSSWSAPSCTAPSKYQDWVPVFPITGAACRSSSRNGISGSHAAPHNRHVFVEASAFSLRAVRAIQTLVELPLSSKGSDPYPVRQKQEQTRLSMCLLLEGLKGLLKLCIHGCGPLRIYADDYTLWQLFGEADQSCAQGRTAVARKLQDRGIPAASLFTRNPHVAELPHGTSGGGHCFYVGRRTGKRLYFWKANKTLEPAVVSGAAGEECPLAGTGETALSSDLRSLTPEEGTFAERDGVRGNESSMNEGERVGGKQKTDSDTKTARASKTGRGGGARGPQIRFCGEYTRDLWNTCEEHGDVLEMAWPFTGTGQRFTERTRLPILPVFVMLLVRLGSASVRAGCAHAMEHLGDWKTQLKEKKKLRRAPVKILRAEIEKSTARRKAETKQCAGGERQIQMCLGLRLIPGKFGHRRGAGEPALSGVFLTEGYVGSLARDTYKPRYRSGASALPSANRLPPASTSSIPRETGNETKRVGSLVCCGWRRAVAMAALRSPFFDRFLSLPCDRLHRFLKQLPFCSHFNFGRASTLPTNCLCYRQAKVRWPRGLPRVQTSILHDVWNVTSATKTTVQTLRLDHSGTDEPQVPRTLEKGEGLPGLAGKAVGRNCRSASRSFFRDHGG
ncbi:hypothetical protein CSUI_010446 [Cystoisospora suis]|uniref:Uncharacterized protein n=1 Tax=Cystoisospora suis TaxID=483139 RepID=A0A2C6KGS2_9APIC|nr:hypothetical protein CSUI_010446 [Cystoisospora suis]